MHRGDQFLKFGNGQSLRLGVTYPVLYECLEFGLSHLDPQHLIVRINPKTLGGLQPSEARRATRGLFLDCHFGWSSTPCESHYAHFDQG